MECFLGELAVGSLDLEKPELLLGQNLEQLVREVLLGAPLLLVYLLVVLGFLGVLQFLLLGLGVFDSCLGQLGRERNVVDRLDDLGELDPLRHARLVWICFEGRSDGWGNLLEFLIKLVRREKLENRRLEAVRHQEPLEVLVLLVHDILVVDDLDQRPHGSELLEFWLLEVGKLLVCLGVVGLHKFSKVRRKAGEDARLVRLDRHLDIWPLDGFVRRVLEEQH